ncbi:unnamed protein product [Symbiodinium microadriaticum]|nr:unnamed protein product [Symbiodinium microadriaticum]CAE7948661.1 unnamed protein product [Symbiodinium sp. KB8]
MASESCGLLVGEGKGTLSNHDVEILRNFSVGTSFLAIVWFFFVFTWCQDGKRLRNGPQGNSGARETHAFRQGGLCCQYTRVAAQISVAEEVDEARCPGSEEPTREAEGGWLRKDAGVSGTKLPCLVAFVGLRMAGGLGELRRSLWISRLHSLRARGARELESLLRCGTPVALPQLLVTGRVSSSAGCHVLCKTGLGGPAFVQDLQGPVISVQFPAWPTGPTVLIMLVFPRRAVARRRCLQWGGDGPGDLRPVCLAGTCCGFSGLREPNSFNDCAAAVQARCGVFSHGWQQNLYLKPPQILHQLLTAVDAGAASAKAEKGLEVLERRKLGSSGSLHRLSGDTSLFASLTSPSARAVHGRSRHLRAKAAAVLSAAPSVASMFALRKAMLAMLAKAKGLLQVRWVPEDRGLRSFRFFEVRRVSGHPQAVSDVIRAVEGMVSQSFACKGRMQRRLSSSRADRMFTKAASFHLKGQMPTPIDTATLVFLIFLAMCQPPSPTLKAIEVKLSQ